MNRSAILLTVAAFLLTSGCVVRHGDFSVLSNKLIRTSDFELSKADRKKNAVGKDTAHIIIFIPTGTPTLEQAIDNALRNGEGDVMTDAVVTYSGWYIPYIYGQFSWKVEGDVVKTRRN